MLPDILKLERKKIGEWTIHYFPEYSNLVEDIVNFLPDMTDEGSNGGTRSKRHLTVSGIELLLNIERGRFDPFRSLSELFLNYSKKEILIARALSQLGNFSDKHGSVEYEIPIGYLEGNGQRFSIFLYDETITPTPRENVPSSLFAFFPMVYNGVLHMDGGKDFIPYDSSKKKSLFVVDFEHSEFVESENINATVDRILFTMTSRNSVIYQMFFPAPFDQCDVQEPSRQKVMDMPYTERREYLIGKLKKLDESLARRVRNFLEPRGYFEDEVIIGPAYETVMQIRKRI